MCRSSSADISAVAGSSRSGITIGGWLMIRYLPSTSSASLDSACRLSRVRAFAAIALARFSPFFASFFGFPLPVFPRFLIAASSSCSDRCAYQTSIVPISANPAIASRYARTDSSVAARVSALAKPLLRPAIVKLAAMRFTSYSNGPGSVSSKSFTSNSSGRSGDANMPKFDRCASPQSCTSSPARGVSFRSAAMIFAAPR